MHIIIAGGGIGGLTAALCLAKFDHEVTLLEQAPAFTEVGAGLQIGPNGMKVLRALGLEEAARSVAFEPERIELRFGESGRTIFTIPLGARAEARWGAPYLQFHRADLMGVLADAVMAHPNIAIENAARVVGYEEEERAINVKLSDGMIFSGDLLVGADGIHSIVREQMLGKETPVFTGCVAWRGVVPFERLKKHPTPPTAAAWVGRGKHAVTYRLRRGELVNFVGVVEQDAFHEESWSARGTKTQIARDFDGWHPVIREIIEEGEEFFRWGLFGRPVIEDWCSPRAVLLGDAVHPTLPFLAQGAVMAIEDAWVLADCLSVRSEPLRLRLTKYQQRRLPHTRRIQDNSRRNKTIFHLESPIARLGVYGPMKLGGMLTPGIVISRMDWMYGQDVTT